jgi:hypothetical protein
VIVARDRFALLRQKGADEAIISNLYVLEHIVLREEDLRNEARESLVAALETLEIRDELTSISARRGSCPLRLRTQPHSHG